MALTALSDRLMLLKEAFFKEFRSAPVAVVRAPGRVNLIGEHTDYNEGFVLPAAIDRDMLIAASPAADAQSDRVEIYSLEYKESDSFSLQEIEPSPDKQWANYLRAVVKTMQNQGFALPPFHAVLTGNVPQGAGLSSSAAYEVAAATLINELCSLSLTSKQIALIGQKAENEFVGVKCGIMDQFVSALGQEGAALFIDCRSLDFEAVPMACEENECALVITNSGVRRGLVDSAYNERRQACQEGAERLAQLLPRREVKSLRDVAWKDFQRLSARLPEVLARRCRHVISENERVLKAVAALKKGKLKELGRLMNASHQSLQKDYEVSSPEIDLLVQLTQSHAGTLGSRITGAGFGGCTVSLIKSDQVKSYQIEVIAEYQKQTGRQAEVYVCRASAGAGLIRH